MNQNVNSNPLLQGNDNKQKQVYKQIKEAISRNEFPPGTVMVERKLCDLYNVSRSPIRNALQQLAFEGLLAYSPTKGIIVPEYKLEDILEVYDLVEVLQLYAIGPCIQRMDDLALGTLKVVMANMKRAIENNDLMENNTWDRKFHEFIISKANNNRLTTIFEQLSNQQVRFLVTTYTDSGLAEQSYQEHAAIYEAMAARDTGAAETAIRQHYSRVKEYYIGQLINRI